MRLVAYADIHFHHSWPEFNPLQPSGLTRWLEIQIDVWKQIDDYAKRRGAIKVFAGDLVHKRSFIHTTVINSILDLYKAKESPEVMISGNHDRYNPDFNAVQALHGVGNTMVLNGRSDPYWRSEPPGLVVSIQGADAGGPVPPPAAWEVKPGFANPEHFKILLAHGVLNGAESQSGFELEGGYNRDDFSQYDLVIMGDIHKKQQIGNILIPGSPMEHNWGDASLECGFWEIEISLDAHGKKQHQMRFIPVKAPKFTLVMQDNLAEVLAIETDEFNYYDFKITEALDREAIKELRRRFPNSYIVPPVTEKTRAKGVISRDATDSEILAKYYEMRIKGPDQGEFTTLGQQYLTTGAPNQISGGQKDLQFLWMRAENFMCFQSVFIDFRTMEAAIYLIGGSTDEETTLTNSIGKSALTTEVICFTLFDKLARSSTRSKDRLIHDPHRTGNAKGLLTEVGLRVDGKTFIIQRFRKHPELGTGVRLLTEESVEENAL